MPYHFDVDTLSNGTLTPQQGQHLGKSSETIFLLMEKYSCQILKPHLIREIQKNPN